MDENNLKFGDFLIMIGVAILAVVIFRMEEQGNKYKQKCLEIIDKEKCNQIFEVKK